MSFTSNNLTITPLRPLGSHETKNDLDVWWAKCKVHLKNSNYKELMVLTWTAQEISPTRGLEKMTINGKEHTAEQASILVGDMLEAIISAVPEVTLSDVTSGATSLQWVYDFLRYHYGCERTGMDMLLRFETLERRPREKVTSYWSRFKGFYQDNRIKKDDKLTIDEGQGPKKATEDEKQCRFSKSTELAIFLHGLHPMLPKKMAQIFANKLKKQDLASLREPILDKCQQILDELEGSHAEVNRMSYQQQPQRYNNYQRNPPARRQTQRPVQRSGGASARYKTPSPARAPKHPENYCFLCVRDGKPNASDHFLRQCPQLPKRERDLWTKVFDKALLLRNVPRDSWPKKIESQTVSVKLISMVEDYYDLDLPQEETEPEDLFAEDEEPATMSDYMGMQEESSTEPTISMKSVKIRCNRIDCGCGCTCKDNPSDPVNRRVTVSPSPALQVELTNNQTGATKHDALTCDTGCTAECIVNSKLVRGLGLPLLPTNVKTATLGDGETSMTIVGEVSVDTEYMGNPIKVRAVVADDVEGILLGMPGLEKCGIDVISSKKELLFPNGVRFNYITKTITQVAEPRARAVSAKESRVIARRILLQAPPTNTLLNPGESITLTTKPGAHMDNGRCLIAPHPEAKSSTHEWMATGTHDMTDGTITITNTSAMIQKINAKDHVAQSFAMVDPETITDSYTEPPKKEPKKEPQDDVNKITIDPSNLLPAETKQQFADACKQFSQVFGPDLPKYNGAFGRVEAVIHIPKSLPPSERLKEVPWYPKTLLVELQQKMDELTEKGAMARPQDIGVNIEAMSPSFLVKKKPPSNGYRLVTSFGNLAAYVRTAPSPMPCVDTILRRISAWKWIVTADISQAYHQLSLSKES